jgi:hypothetical protein
MREALSLASDASVNSFFSSFAPSSRNLGIENKSVLAVEMYSAFPAATGAAAGVQT